MKRTIKALIARGYLVAEACANEYRVNIRLGCASEELERFCGKIGSNSVIEPGGAVLNMKNDPTLISIGDHTRIAGRLLSYPTGGSISVGDWCYIGQRSEIWAMTEVSIGDRVFLSHDVNVHDTNSHSLDPKLRHEHYRFFQANGSPSRWDDLPDVQSSPIRIEDDCWLGFGVTVFKGVTIGKGSVIAARSIVTRDVPPNSFYRCEFSPVITPLTGKVGKERSST